MFDTAPESQKAENLKRAAELRARLLAQRQQAVAQHIRQAEFSANGPATEKHTNAAMESGSQKATEAPKDPFGVESLLAEGKTAAAAKGHEGSLPSTAPPTAVRDQAMASNPTIQHTHQPTVPAPKPSVERTNNDVAMRTQPEQPEPPTDLTDAYYADLPLWLEVTGYHDIEFRNSQLSNIKERKRLEQDAARIAERLAKLNKDAQVNVSFKRSTPAPQLGCEIQRPPLPAMMPSANATPAVAGVKRAHSPAELLPSKVVCATPKSEMQPCIPRYNNPEQATSRNLQQDSLLQDTRAIGDLERRVTFPEPRRGPRGGRRRGRPQDTEKGYGLERDRRAPSPERYSRRGPLLDRDVTYARDHDIYEPPRGGGPPRGYENQGRLGYGNVNSQDYNGGQDRDRRRGGPCPEFRGRGFR